MHDNISHTHVHQLLNLLITFATIKIDMYIIQQELITFCFVIALRYKSSRLKPRWRRIPIIEEIVETEDIFVSSGYISSKLKGFYPLNDLIPFESDERQMALIRIFLFFPGHSFRNQNNLMMSTSQLQGGNIYMFGKVRIAFHPHGVWSSVFVLI